MVLISYVWAYFDHMYVKKEQIRCNAVGNQASEDSFS